MSRKPPSDKSKRNRLFATVFFIGVVAFLGLALGPGMLQKFMTKRADDKPVQATRPADPVTQALEQGNMAVEAFKRGVTAGFTPQQLTFGQTGAEDLGFGLKFLPYPLQSATGLSSPEQANWALGGGQIVGAAQDGAPDIVFYLTPLSAETCRNLNRQIWGVADAEPVASGVAVADWKDRAANVLQLFGGKNRTSACVQTKEGQYLFYQMVYGTKANEPVTPGSPLVE